jgi:hypothetical protein
MAQVAAFGSLFFAKTHTFFRGFYLGLAVSNRSTEM